MVADQWREFVRRFRDGAHQEFAQHWQLFQESVESLPDSDPPMAVWWPGERERRASHLARLLQRTGKPDYRALHRWSVEHRSEFWRVVIEDLEIAFHRSPECTLDLSRGPEDPVWLPGAELNIVESCFQAPPDSTAIVFAGEDDPQPVKVSYAELAQRVSRVADGLRRHGIGPGAAIVLYMPMTVDCVAAYLGIVHAGCQVVSVADSFSAGELRRRMQIAGATAAITLASYPWAGRQIDLYAKVRQAIDGLAAPARAIVIPPAATEPPELAPGDLWWDDFLGSSARLAAVVGSADRPTNILFSSGTTGDPKAIPWTQLTPIKCAMDARFHQDVHAGDVVAWPTNIGWMMGPWLIYAALLNRAALALFAGAPHSAPFVRFVDDVGVTMFGLVPALVRAWRSRGLVPADSWRSVRVFSSTGEVSNPEDYLWLMSRAGYRAPVIEYLGGTEIGGGHVTGSVLLPASPSTFSTPALGIDFLILDENGRPSARGELGELFLKPPAIGLSQTLLNKDHHQIYYQDCPEGPDGEILRRHGDEFVELGGGYYKAQGRTDDTMNLGGIKVSSIEIEEVINEDPLVFESAAIAVPVAGHGAESLVLYVVPSETGARADLPAELGRRLAEELNPLFKIHRVVTVDSLPRTASNKVMRRQLRDRYLEALQSDPQGDR